MGDVGVELGASVFAACGACFREFHTTLTAMHCAQAVFCGAFGAAIGEFATGHRDEGALGAVDDFQVPNDETPVNRDRTEGPEAFLRVVHQFDADFGNVHGCVLPAGLIGRVPAPDADNASEFQWSFLVPSID